MGKNMLVLVSLEPNVLPQVLPGKLIPISVGSADNSLKLIKTLPHIDDCLPKTSLIIVVSRDRPVT